MAGAIGLAFERRERAIGKISAPRIAQRPPAGGCWNVLQPQPSHLSDLGYAKARSWPPVVPRRNFGIVSDGGAGALRVDVGPSGMRWRPFGPRRAERALPAHGGASAAQFDSDPACLADDRVSGSDAKRRGDVACAFSLKSEPLEVLDCLGGPQHLHGSNRCRCGVPPRGIGLRVDILVPAGRGDVAASAAQ